MNKTNEHQHSLQFHNMEKLNSHSTPKPGNDSLNGKKEYSPTWECYLRYFLEYKKLITLSAIFIPLLVFTLFQNKIFKANVGFKIEPGQDLTSNILSESLMGIRPNKNSLGNIPQRALSKAQSVGFYQELAQEVLSNEDYVHTRFKLVEERKGWVEFIKKRLLGQEELDNEGWMRARVSEHLEKVIRVQKSSDNTIQFTVSTKNKGLTENIQTLIKNSAGSLLIKDPLEEAATALKIIEQSEEAVFKELDELDVQMLTLQEEFKTLIPEELPSRYANMRLEIEKNLLQNVTKERGLQRKIKQLDRQARKDVATDFSLKKEKELLFKELISVQAGTKHLNKRLKGLESEYKGLPLFSSKIEKYSLRKKILLEKLNRLTEQISMAKLSYEKVKSSLSHLNANEKIQVTSTLKILVKTMIVSFGLLGGLVAFLYYKQSLFPILMKKDQLGMYSNDVAITLTKGSSSKRDKQDWAHTHPRSVALQNFYHKQVKKHKWIGLVSLSRSEGAEKDISDILRHSMQRGKKVVMIMSDDGEFSAKEAKNLKRAFPDQFKFIITNTKSNATDLVNKKIIRKVLNANSDADHTFVTSRNLSASPDGIILSQITHKTFVFAKLFATTERSVQRFTNRRESLPHELQGKFAFVLTNASAYDDINTFIGPQFNKTGELSEKKPHLQKVG